MEQVTLFAIAPLHTMPLVHAPLQIAIEHALMQTDDGRSLDDLSMAIALTHDAPNGRQALRHVMSTSVLDSLILFGKTVDSVVQPEQGHVLAPLQMVHVRFRWQVRPVRCVALPPVMSSWWGDEANHIKAGAAVKPLIKPADPSCLPETTPIVSMEHVEFN